MRLYLNQGETIIYRSKRHWITLLPPGLLALVGLFCTCCTLLIGIAEPPPGQPPPPEQMMICLVSCVACILGLALLWAISTIIHYDDADFVLTNRRVIVQRSRHSLDIPLGQIDNVYIETPPLGRWLGYGTVLISSGSGQQLLSRYAQPEEIRQHVQEQISRLGR